MVAIASTVSSLVTGSMGTPRMAMGERAGVKTGAVSSLSFTGYEGVGPGAGSRGKEVG